MESLARESGVKQSYHSLKSLRGANPTCSRLIACPTELIKIRQQSAPPHLYPSTLSVFTDILRQGGVRGLYRGFSATAMRDVAYGPYFCT